MGDICFSLKKLSEMYGGSFSEVYLSVSENDIQICIEIKTITPITKNLLSESNLYPFHFERDPEKQNLIAARLEKAINLRAPKKGKQKYIKMLALKCGVSVKVLQNNMRQRKKGGLNKNVSDLTAAAIITLEEAGIHRDEILGPIKIKNSEGTSAIENHPVLRGLYKIMIEHEQNDVELERILKKLLQALHKHSSPNLQKNLKHSDMPQQDKNEAREIGNEKMKNTQMMLDEIQAIIEKYLSK